MKQCLIAIAGLLTIACAAEQSNAAGSGATAPPSE